jgi:NADPH2:quinone reductase
MTKINEQCHVVQITKQGPPSVLEYTTQYINTMGDDEVLIEQKAIGFNFLDIFYRNGTFPLDSFPAPIGIEAAGIITAKGEAVTNFELGGRVVYWWSMGAYADRKVVNVKDIFKLPEDIPFDQAASFLVKGLTAYMLLKNSYPIKKGDVVLIHAVSGGVGSLLSRWAKSLGATVIGTVGSLAKKEVAINNLADHVIVLDSENFVDEVMSFTGGKGINVLYDSVGQDTFNKSTELFIEGGSAVLFGWSSGMPVIDEEHLSRKRITYVRARFNDYWLTLENPDGVVNEVFEAFRTDIFGEIKPTIYALANAVQAHADMEARKTTGAIIFHP